MPDDPLARDRRRDQVHLLHSLHNAALQREAHVWTAGRGAILIDEDSREYLDALAGLWNVIVGHGRTELARAAADQMERLAFASSYAGGSNRPAIDLAERLAGICYPHIQRFFFTCGGAEANEAAFKTARFFWKAARQARQDQNYQPHLGLPRHDASRHVGHWHCLILADVRAARAGFRAD